MKGAGYKECCLAVWIVCLVACSQTAQGPAPVRTADNDYSSYSRASISSDTYKVRPGDTLYSIAWLTGIDFRTLADLNKIKPPYLIYRGQSLKIRPRQPKKIVNNPSAKKHSNTLSHQEKKVDKGHKNIVDSKSSEGYRRSQAGQEDTASKTKTLPRRVAVQWQWPTKGRLLSRFSASQTGSKGIDIKGKFGQSVAAAGDGKVVYAGSGLRGYGELIIIKHSDEFLSAYAHNSRLRVKEGQWVKAGQLIANMGSTGTDSVKLRFEIRLKGRPVDPLRYLPR